MSQEGLILPTIINPVGIRCVTLFVPNDQAYISAVDGAILRIAQWQAWQRDPLKRGTQAATRMRETYNSMVWDTCVTADIYRINPINGCQWQVSHDGGATWHLFWDATACEPNTAHFLVDDPGVTRENGVSPVSGHYGLLVNANNQTGIGVEIDSTSFPAADLYAFGGGLDYPPLRLGRANLSNRGFLQLSGAGTETEAINRLRMFIPPYLTTADADLQNLGGIYVKVGDARGHIILPDGHGGYHDQVIGSGDGDGTVIGLSESYTHLADGSTPRLVLTLPSPGIINIDLGLPTIPLPTVYNGDYTLLPAGSAPNFTITTAIIEDSLSVVGHSFLPPIPLPTTFDEDNDVVQGLSAPELTIIDSSTSTARTVDIILRIPPTPGQFTVPLTGTQHYALRIDAYGTVLPILLPLGYVLSGFATTGLWANLDHLSDANYTLTNGERQVPGELNSGDLAATVLPADVLGGIDTAIDTISPYDGYTMPADGYLFFSQAFGVEFGAQISWGRGELYAEFDIAAPGSPYDWIILIDYVTNSMPAGVTTSSNNQGVAGGEVPGTGYGGVSTYTVQAQFSAHGDSTTHVTHCEFDMSYVDPGYPASSYVDFHYQSSTYGPHNHHLSPQGVSPVSASDDFDEAYDTGTYTHTFRYAMSAQDYPLNVYSSHSRRYMLAGTGTAPTIV